ncbi:MAG: DNA mismatch repair endonuclease MutL, partial [Planctomycetota bacterium]
MVKVENIFFNTPARRKFLKSAATEIGHIGEAITRLALAHPGVTFTLFHNEKNVFRAPGTSDLRERISQFFGKDFSAGLIPATEEAGALRLEALAAPPHETRSSSQNQYIYVNNRFLRDRVILAAIAEAYREFMEPRRHPIVFCFIDMPPEEVDVNVHPTKIEVRFSKPNQIFSLVRGALHDSLRSGHLAVPVSIHRAKQPPGQIKPREKTPDIPAMRGRMSPPLAGEKAGASRAQPADTGASQTAPGALEPEAKPQTQVTETPEREPGKIPEVFIQLHDSFIIVETERGFEVIDQHALHERIIYEKLMKARETRSVESQQLLVPESIELQPGRAALALDNIETFRSFGIDIEDFGKGTILIRSVPAVLRRTDPLAFFRDLLDELVESGAAKGPVDPGKLLATIACKGAVKAGQRLTRGEIIALLSDRESLGDSYACP